MSEPSSLTVDQNTLPQKATESTTTLLDKESSRANNQSNKASKSNQLATIEKPGSKTIRNSKVQSTLEATENNNSPSRGGSIGVTKCPVCGKQFGKSSLRFHQPQCEEKQAALQEKHEQEKLEEKQKSSYIICEDFDTGKK